MTLWLDPIPPELREKACADLDRGDVGGFLIKASNTHHLALVYHNLGVLLERGIFEEALLLAHCTSRTNNHDVPDAVLRGLFRIADRKRLHAAGDPLPGPGPFTLFRGVAGRGPARRVRGISWTADFDRARWFAERFTLADPAVFRAVVDERDVLAYTNERKEQEFVIMLPFGATPRRVWP